MNTNWFILLTSYFVVWWVVLFTVLPLSVRRDERPETGHDPGAPQQANIRHKFALTTVYALAVWLVLVALVELGAWDKLTQWVINAPLF